MLGNTPMMLQYEDIKKDYQDCLLFYRLGDFYEMFGEDAEVGSKLLGITLTGRDAGLGRIPMCGVPFHSVETYIAKAIAAGKKVAICEQVEDPKSVKGIVKREVIRMISPGTVLESGCLEEKSNNYMIALTHDETGYGMAIVDVSTGAFMATELSDTNTLQNEFWRYDPVECLVSVDEENMADYVEELIGEKSVVLTKHGSHAFELRYATERICEQFGILTLDGLGCTDKPLAVKAAGAILDYLQLMQKTKPGNIMTLKVYTLGENMALDYATKRNLELIRSLHGNEKRDSLFGVIDYTRTAAGSRQLKSWLEKPLIHAKEIQNRLDATEEVVNNPILRNRLKEHLDPVYDLERIMSRVAYGTANAKDLLALKNSLAMLPQLAEDITIGKTSYFSDLKDSFDTLDEIYDLLERAIHPDAPFTMREGNLIRDGYHAELDELRDIIINGKQWLVDLEVRERERTGIKNLKVSYNKVFGYYIDITRSKSGEVPEEYVRKQTLANSERFITPELKELEDKILGADESIKELEYRLFTEIRSIVGAQMQRILKTAEMISRLDCIYSLGTAAVYHNFVKPRICNDGNYRLKSCRHPIVEQKLKNSWFVPNDITMNSEDQRFLIITGPNMAGKSTYCRSIALATVMMQIGSFVAATDAELPVIDRVFARIGASDDLSTGQSTFMVEMNEVANIVNHATKDSLIILDEVGRGTSTYDGLAIAWALTDYINQQIQAKTLFATHYHELTVLEEQEGIRNFSVAVKEDGDNIVFLRKIIPGGADRSYGIHVAKLAGIPKSILRQAEQHLVQLETDKQNHLQNASAIQLDLFMPDELEQPTTIQPMVSEVVEELASVNLLQLTPLDAMNLLYRLQTKAKEEL